MADITITATSVANYSDAKPRTGIAGEAGGITAGMALYKNSSGQYVKANAATGSPATAKIDGIALSGAAQNQPFTLVEPASGGHINLGATLVVGQTYVLSASGTPGAIAPFSDLASGNYVVVLGVARTASKLLMSYFDPDVAKA